MKPYYGVIEEKMKDKEVEALYTEFNEWLHKVRGFMCAGDTLSTIKLWEEWLRLRKKQNKEVKNEDIYRKNT